MKTPSPTRAKSVEPPNPAEGPTAREWLWVALVTLLGGALRLGMPDGLGIEHFDEGVYASNLWFGADAGFQYPMRHLYAPPLLPAAIEWSLILTRIAPWGAFIPGLLAGVLMAPSVWWVTRSWFGSTAGIAAATLAALSDVHAVFSRMALTDAPLVLALLWGIFATGETLRRRGGKMFVLAVAASAMAWWTKYNGWLALAIPTASLVLYWLAAAPARQLWRSSAAWLSLIVLLTGLLWAPVVWALQPVGGYAAVSANHAKYVGGLSSWPAHALQQIENLRELESADLAACAPLLAFLVSGFWLLLRPAHEPRSAGRLSAGGLVLVFTAAAAWALTWVLAGCGIALGGIAVFLLIRELVRVRPTTHPFTWPLSVLTVWCIGLLGATPLYHPYARLTLPWLVSTWILAGWGVARCWAAVRSEAVASDPRISRAEFWGWWGLPVLGTVATFGMVSVRGERDGAVAWESHAGTRLAARQIVEHIQSTGGSLNTEVILVYGEPAMFFELRLAGAPNVLPLGNIRAASSLGSEMRRTPWVVLGPHSEHDASVQEWLRTGASGTNASFDFQPATAVRLDRHSPRQLRELGEFQPEQFQLVTPRSGT